MRYSTGRQECGTIVSRVASSSTDHCICQSCGINRDTPPFAVYLNLESQGPTFDHLTNTPITQLSSSCKTPPLQPNHLRRSETVIFYINSSRCQSLESVLREHLSPPKTRENFTPDRFHVHLIPMNTTLKRPPP